MEKIRTIEYFENYFFDFFQALPISVRVKINEVLLFVQCVEMVPPQFLKKIIGVKGLFEIRVMAGSDIYRIFCCFDAGRVILLLNGFQKKDQKTPKREIEKAQRLMVKYFNQKTNGK